MEQDIYDDWSASAQGAEDMDAAGTLPPAERPRFLLACLRDYASVGGVRPEDFSAMSDALLALIERRMRAS